MRGQLRPIVTAKSLPQVTAKREGVGPRVVGFEAFPVVSDMDKLSREMVGTLRGEEKSQLDLFVGRDAAGETGRLRFFNLARAGQFVGVEDLVGHAGIGVAGSDAVDLYVVLTDFFGQTFGKSHHGCLTGGEGCEVRPGLRSAVVDHGENLALAAVHHRRQHGPAGIHDADHVSIEDLFPVLRLVADERTDRAENGRVGNEDMDIADQGSQAIDSGGELAEIADVGAQTMRNSAGVFDLQLGNVQFALVSSEKADFDAGVSKSDGEALANSAPGACDQRGHMLLGGQTGILPPDGPTFV
jgi:hypothetical protein